MTDHDALHRAVLESPHDDLPRLMYADFLTDRDEPGDAERSEFIRVQVELAKMPGCEGDPDCEHFRSIGLLNTWCRGCWPKRDLWTRESELLAGDHGRNWRHWAGDAVKIVPGGAPYYDHIKFSRGFVSDICLPLSSFTAVTVCDRCLDGVVMTVGEHKRHDCSACGCLGRVRGRPEIFKKNPVTRVVLTDQWPFVNARGFWVLIESNTGYTPGIWQHIRTEPGRVTATFATIADATNALSDACVAYGRQLAGLPPLKGTP